jgi:hypothetical protein
MPGVWRPIPFPRDQTYARFSLVGDVEPPAITEAMGIQPDWTTGSDGRYVWGLFTRLDEREPAVHLLDLLRRLEPAAAALTALRSKGLRASIGVNHLRDPGGFGYTLESDVLLRMAACCDAFDVTERIGTDEID